FGFALFFLRSVAPREDYHDKVTGKLVARVTTGQIYWGSVPFIVIQLTMVAAVMLFPGMVTHYKADVQMVDPSTIEFGLDDVYGADNFGDSGSPFGSDDPASLFGGGDPADAFNAPSSQPLAPDTNANDPAAAFR